MVSARPAIGVAPGLRRDAASAVDPRLGRRGADAFLQGRPPISILHLTRRLSKFENELRVDSSAPVTRP